MDGFTYHDIFQTKGIEYLVIILFLLLLIPFWVIINRSAKVARTIRKALGTLTTDILKVPRGLFYSRNHTWTYMEKTGEARIGLDDLLLHITGEVKLRYLRNPEEFIIKGQTLAEIYQEDRILTILSPVSGRILHTNPALDGDPGILNDDPYGKGWICMIEPTNWIEDTRTSYLAEDAVKWLRLELNRFKDFLDISTARHSPASSTVILQDGGELSDQALSKMPAETWRDFQEEFLNQTH